ncbi:UDP-N-acetylmuramyl pentapeptide phosphotransferase/UDP-N-acetylglucosamine-1-phosphate transferase [Paraburkholderia caballeronis]|uniref:MraY family glycosyltransferase n=1 Tax=Paraburkholderia caballeronis TaxID=416943 RepID=UPI00106528DD|nr:glycosyltransferase family 4 protein [Paraburkholderia caballeronis]TDV34714.1 UDP-N-acetylmuramyl pentapeptide phosphotransferase/UDP-N-acetylglucosamine-1-phosphate transferase [Paraburkholderia caballeronis]
MNIISSSLSSIAAVMLVAAILAAAILRMLIATGWAWRLATDIPNHRSLHSLPTPRVGGWSIVPVSAAFMVVAGQPMWPVAALTVGLAVVSQIDDRRGLTARVRFAAHLAAVAALLIVYPVSAPWWMLVAIGFLMLWLVNLYNFMDGIDGLAGGMALFGFSAYAIAALGGAHASPEMAMSGAAIAGAALGFLFLNFHPAKLFLGDAGSVPLGFLAGALGYWGWRGDVWPLGFPAMVFSPFIADATVTLLKRLLRGEKFWQAHREHYYQRMVRSGIGHARTAICWYAVMLAGIMLAWWTLDQPEWRQWVILAAWYGTLACLGAVIDLRWRRFEGANAR